MDESNIGAGDDAGVELEALETADMHARLEPLGGKDRLHAVGGAHDGVGSRDRFPCRRDRNDLNAELCAHLPGECFAPFAVRAVTSDPLDVSNSTDRHRLAAGLPAGAEDGNV